MKIAIPLIALAFCCAASAESVPEDLLVFNPVLPDIPRQDADTTSPVVRWDKVPDNNGRPGVTLISAHHSVVKRPEVLLSYDAAGATLDIHIVDDADVTAPSVRLNQEKMAAAVMPSFVDSPGITWTKVRIVPDRSPADAFDGYLIRRDPGMPQLQLLIPDGHTGRDRFWVQFGFRSALDTQPEAWAAWLLKAAATIEIDRLKNLP
jgi:hypothetical protein